MTTTLYQGDCLKLMDKLENESVDLILTDPPYGVITDGSASISWKKRGRTNQWDKRLPIGPMFAECSRVLRPNGKCVLFAQEPFTSLLVTGTVPSLPFSYRAIWLKNGHANALNSKKTMLSRFEDVCVFSRIAPKYDFDGKNPLRSYFVKVLEFIEANGDGRTGRRIVLDSIGGKADHVTRVDTSQFALCAERTYKELTDMFGIDRMDGFRTYEELRSMQHGFADGYEQHGYKPSVFNLWEGGKSKSNVLEYPRDREHYHPTQKPVALLEDLIRTFSNPGDTVLDFTMGSGSTGVACVNTGRDFIGIELDPHYYEIAEKRIADAGR